MPSSSQTIPKVLVRILRRKCLLGTDTGLASSQVALWNQKLAPEDDIMPVVWDYHVVALFLPCKDQERMSTAGIHKEDREATSQAWIYDFDSRIPTPALLESKAVHDIIQVYSHDCRRISCGDLQ